MRHKHPEGYIRRIISIPHGLDEKLTKLLLDPLRKKRAYGSLTTLVNYLLEEWVRKQHKEEEPDV